MQSKSKQDTSDLRRRQLAAIHTAKRDLDIDDDQYRELLQQWTGKRSAGDLNGRERSQVLEQLRRIGADGRTRYQVGQYPGTPANLHTEPMLQKIEAQLADMQLPWAYADAIAKQQTGIGRIAWLRKEPQLKAVIAALDVEQEKRSLLAKLQDRLKEKGITEQQLEDKFQLKKGWQRRRKTLSKLIEQLWMED
jgi:phage gp16-like protein